MQQGVLEMEEVEDLIHISAVGGGGRRTAHHNMACLASAGDCLCEPAHRKKVLCLSFLVAFLLMWMVSNSSGSGVDQADGSTTKTATTTTHLSHVDPKAAPKTTDAPRPSPAPAKVDPSPKKDDLTPTKVPTPDEQHTNTPEPQKEKKDESTPVPGSQSSGEESSGSKGPTLMPSIDATTTDQPQSTIAPKPAKASSKIPELPLNHDHLPIGDETKESLAAKYGHWHFWDGDAESRPKEDYCAKYPNRDIPGDDFPDNSWQVDAVYVNHFLNDADQLVSRAMEAIFEEYGHGKPLSPEGLAERMKMFHWEKVDLATAEAPPTEYTKRGQRDNGGWTTQRSFDGLVRRLLHAMITQDNFTVVMGGHSAASGAGNHFRQSYMMQFHAVMEPIFARLGVKLTTRNIGQGGLGTIQAALGMAGIYGDEIDLLLWDSGMTENMIPEHIDLYLRQGIFGGKRVPVLWGGTFGLLRMLHNEADADVGEYGTGMLGVPITMDEKEAATIPWAARFMKCDPERKDLCEARFNATCWIDRPDGVKPAANQRDRPRGQVRWHPGWRPHQLQGRVLAFSVLEALQVAVNQWMEGTMAGQPLDDDYWHVTDYYKNIREKAQKLDPSMGSCYNIEGSLPTRMCTTPMQGRTQYTPRADPDTKSITSIMKPAPDGYIPKNEKTPLYEGSDMHNPVFDIPKGEVDVVAVVMNRRRLYDSRVESTHTGYHKRTGMPLPDGSERRLDESIVPGKGWQVFDEPEGYCDGTYEAQCARDTNNECFLYGMHDARGAVIGTDKAGWMAMELTNVKEGIIVIKLHTWHYPSENSRTSGWKTVNNEKEERRRLGGQYRDGISQILELDARRRLMRSYSTPTLPDTFFFDFSIDGKITTLNSTGFMEAKRQIQRVVETLTLLDDEKFNGTKDVEVAVRIRGCDNCAFGVSHIYWA